MSSCDFNDAADHNKCAAHSIEEVLAKVKDSDQVVENLNSAAELRTSSCGDPRDSRDSRDASPVGAGHHHHLSQGSLSSTSSSSDEVTRIRNGFDRWLEHFRSTRPQRDVIWRLGKRRCFHLTH